MFNPFKKKPNYSAIFSSPGATYELIYGDSSKTSEILGDQSFIDAWLSSPQMPRISTLIRQEAIKGDIPSVKQIIWLSEMYYQDSAQISDTSKRSVIQISALTERIMFCDKAIDLGMKDWSYKAMASSKNLYSLLELGGASTSDQAMRDALNGIVKYSKLFLESGYNDSKLIEDAKGLLKHFEPLAKLLNTVSAA
jgi:hypothetical protein